MQGRGLHSSTADDFVDKQNQFIVVANLEFQNTEFFEFGAKKCNRIDKSTDVIYSMTGFGPVQPSTGRVKLFALNALPLHLNTLGTAPSIDSFTSICPVKGFFEMLIL